MTRTFTIEVVRSMGGYLLGVGQPEQWFVYTQDAPGKSWEKHCGPYSTREQAVDWINGIRDDTRVGR